MNNLKELQQFLKEYERTTNSHDFKQVRPLIANDALYWFSDGVHRGISNIERAFVKTWDKIRDEKYQIKNIKWLVANKSCGVCTYDFMWKGKVDGNLKQGRGHGTNIIVKKNKKWQMFHEHLSV